MVRPVKLQISRFLRTIGTFEAKIEQVMRKFVFCNKTKAQTVTLLHLLIFFKKYVIK